MKVLITGGAGQLGRELTDIIPDAISVHRDYCDLTNQEKVHNMVDFNRPDVIVHTAALVGEMTDQMARPTEYLSENVKMNTFIVDAALEYNVDKLIAITSTGIYPDFPEVFYPVDEDRLHDGPPTSGFFSYSIAKRTMAVHIEAASKQYNKNYCHIAVGNMYGKYDRFDNKSHFIATLLKKAHKANINNDNVVLYGTGKPTRQFVNSSDVAKVIKLMIDNGVYESYNLTDDTSISVADVARLILNTLGFDKVGIEYDASKPDGQMRKDVSINKFRKFFPDFQFRLMEEGIKEMYEHNFK